MNKSAINTAIWGVTAIGFCALMGVVLGFFRDHPYLGMYAGMMFGLGLSVSYLMGSFLK
jgi:hypothetical protein